MSLNRDYWDKVDSKYNVFIKVPGEKDQLAYQNDKGHVFTQKNGMGIAVFRILCKRPN